MLPGKRVFRADVNRHPGLQGKPGHADIGRITAARFRQANLRPLLLQQIDDIPWFEDTILASGTTSSTWYALGREIDIAVSLPQAASSSLITISGFIEDTVPAE